MIDKELIVYICKTLAFLVLSTLFVIYASTWMAHPWPTQ